MKLIKTNILRLNRVNLLSDTAKNFSIEIDRYGTGNRMHYTTVKLADKDYSQCLFPAGSKSADFPSSSY
jgi:hypothetical protein